jgi:hypothetical protein
MFLSSVNTGIIGEQCQMSFRCGGVIVYIVKVSAFVINTRAAVSLNQKEKMLIMPKVFQS